MGFVLSMTAKTSGERASLFLLMNSTEIRIKFTFCACDLGIGNHFTIVIVNHEALGALNKAEKLGALTDESD